jgi:hypothetical protein
MCIINTTLLRRKYRTSFATDQNSVSLGMLDIALKKTTGKASFVGRFLRSKGQFQSIPNGDGTDLNSFHIQNLYACLINFSLRVTWGLYWV